MKVLVEIFCPITNRCYDVYIPEMLTVYEIKIMIAQMIESLSESKYFYKDGIVLCDFQNGKILNDYLIFKELDIKNGCKLLLF